MKSIPKTLLLPMLVCFASGVFYNTASAQTPIVTTQINISQYDILYLTDLINAKTQNLNSAVSGFSVDLAPNRQPLDIRIYMQVFVQLRGDAQSGQLLDGYSKKFTLSGKLTLTARDFVKAIGGKAALDPYNENSALKKRITDFAQTTAAAPPGTYNITVKVMDPNSPIVYGSDSKTIVIPYSAVDEVFVEINDPRNGSYSNN